MAVNFGVAWIGRAGFELEKAAIHGPMKFAKRSENFGFVIVSPQCPAGETWEKERLLQLLDAVLAEESIDETRVYGTGLSMGGFGVWELGLFYPERFAAIAPICGGGSLLPILLPAPGKQALLKRLPVWAFHGARDHVVRLRESEHMVEALREIGNKPRFTVYPHAEHDSWTETYENPELYEWFLGHKIKGRATRP